MNFLRRLDQRCPKSHLLSTHLSRRILILCFVAALSGAPVVSAQVVFDNFGPGNTFANGGATETGPSAAVSPGISTGFGFVPSLGGNLDAIVVAIGNVSGANDLHLFLSDGSGGTPGPVLETLGHTQSAPFCTLLSSNSRGFSDASILIGGNHLLFV